MLHVIAPVEYPLQAALFLNPVLEIKMLDTAPVDETNSSLFQQFV